LLYIDFLQSYKNLEIMKKLHFIFFSKYNQVIFEKSSINITKYLYPLKNIIGAGPHTSEWIKSNGFSLLQVDKLNDNLVNFSNL
jgi:hypothetical protein